MNRWLAVAFALFFVPASVSGEEVRADLFADGSGDVELQSADGSVAQPAPTGAENLDLVGGGVWAETEDALTFYVQLADLTEDSQAAPFMDPDYTLDFRFRGQGYRIFVATALGNPVNDALGRDATMARLQMEVGPERYQSVADAEAVLDFGEEAVLVTVPRAAIVDENQAPLSRNATLGQFRATASSLGFFSFPLPTGQQGGPRVGLPRLFDAAPDDGFGADYVLKTGRVDQRGRLFATSDDPVRWTNGEATTLTFTARLTNTGREALPVRVGTSGTDAGWQVAFSDALTVGAGQSVNATLLVTIPFVHNHGLLKTFDATFESTDGSHFASTQLGVYWAEVPQPAGHHDTVWFHSLRQEVPPPFDTVFAGVHGWFSAKQELDEDEGVAIPAQFAMAPGPVTGNRGVAFWGFYLEPELRMGLDFVLEREGLAEFVLDLPVPAVDPRLSVEVHYMRVIENDDDFGPGRGFRIEQVLLAEGSSEALSGPVSGQNVFEVPIKALPEADLIPYGEGGNLYVQVVLDATFLAGGGFLNPEAATPTIGPAESRLRLPLEEYHDPVDLSFQTDGSLQVLAGPDGQERLVNPGRTVVYQFDLDYRGSTAATFHAELTGANVEWATILGDQHFALEPGVGRPLAVAVTAPADARDGDVSDLTLRITDTKNAAVQAGINVRTVVTTTEDIPDEADRGKTLNGELTGDKDSPGVPLALLLAGLAALALRRR